MSLSTAKFPELRDKRNSLFEQAAKSLDELRLPPIEERQPKKLSYARRRFLKRGQERAELEDLASSSSQIKDYGLERWQNECVRLRDIRVPEDSNLSVEQLRDNIWKAILNGKFKRFQEAFSDPHNFVVPAGFKVSSSGEVTFPKGVDLRNHSVKGCLVSIDRISDELIDSLKLIKFTDRQRRSPLERLRAKADINVINKVKLIWDSAEPVAKRDLRALVIQRPEPELLKQYPDIKRFPTGLHGTILYTREDQSGRVVEENPPLGPARVRPLMVQHFPTIFAAYRRTLHVSEGYKDEQQTLTDINTKLDLLRRRIGSRWVQSATREQKRELLNEVTTVFGEAIETLALVKDRNKTEARELIETVREGLDSLGRPNPLVIQGRRSVAVKNLKLRFDRTLGRASYNERDRGILKGLLQAEALVLQETRKSLSQNAELIHARAPAFNRRLPEQVRVRAGRELLDKLAPYRDSLKEVRIRPFSTYAGLLRVGFNELEQAVTVGNFKQSEQVTAKLLLVTQLCAMNVIVERMKERLVVGSEQLSIDPFLNDLRALRQVFESKFSGTTANPKYEERIEGIKDQLREFYSHLNEIKKTKDTLGEKGPIVRDLKRMLKEINSEFIAWEFVPVEWRRGAN